MVIWCESSILGSFFNATISAVQDDSQAAKATQESASGQTTVTSHTSACPICQGTRVRPSGRLPSDLHRPCSSLVLGIDAAERAISSLRWWWWMVLPGARLHMKLWCPWASTWVPQWQRCGMQSCKPSRTPMAVLMASLSSHNLQDAMGRAKSQSPLCCEVAASWVETL